MPNVLRDESGVALGLAVIAVVVFGVVGAGLLLFVRSDLESSIQTDKAQRAFYAADAGVQSAKLQLLGDASIESYDDDGGTPACDSDLDSSSAHLSEWAAGGGEGTLGDATFDANVRWLASGCGSPTGNVERGARFFGVSSVGEFGDARRKIEAVYATSDVDAPLATFAAGNVTLSGAKVSSGSIFSGGNIVVEGNTNISGKDSVYGNWSNGDGANFRPEDAAGLGAAGTISGSPQSISRYDSTTSPAFAAEAESGEVTFPFDPGYWNGASRVDFVADVAQSQGNLLTSAGSLDWPDASWSGTVVFVEPASSGEVVVGASECDADSPCSGTLLVEGSSVRLASGASFKGCIVSSEGDVRIESGAELEGNANSGGSMFVAGKISALGAEDPLSCAGFHGVKVWNWRETYE